MKRSEKKDTLNKLLCGAAFAASFMCTTATAQEQTTENWYQVELLIFKRASTATENEAWPKNLALAYPPNIQHLIEATGQDEQNTDEATTDTPGNPTENAIATPAHTLENTEQPFVALDSSQFFIENATSAIKRERGLHTLFHKTWAQPMRPQETAPAIIIEGGDAFGEYSELSGTITVSVSRYLHLHTDLWLAEFEANYGQESYHWPKIPMPPTAATENSTSGEIADYESSPGFQLSDNRSSDGFNLNLNVDQVTPDNAMNNEWSSLTNKPYLVKHITTLTQKRRMRSNELHYIDHPKMGILVKIIPYTPKHLQPEPNN